MITRLQVSGYKSLAEVDVGLGPLAVVVGPNNVGKSNVFDLLKLVSAFAEGPLEKAFEDHRGDPVESFFDPDEPVMRIALEVDLSGAPPPGAARGETLRYPRLQYELRIEWDPARAIFLVRDEQLAGAAGVRPRRKNPFIGCDDDGERLRVTREGGGGHPRFFDRGGTRTVLSQIDDGELYPTIVAVQQYLRSWGFYHFDPEALREPSPQLNILELASDGRGLSGLLDTLRRSADTRAAFEAIERELVAAIPEVDRLSIVDTGDRRRLLQLVQRAGNEFTGRVVSDGVLRFLALLALTYTPRPGGLVCFEEPENGVHPSRLQFVVNHLRGITRPRPGATRCQVLLNTHSPYLVDHLAPEELVVATMDERGATRLRRLEPGLLSGKPQVREALEREMATLGEVWYGGRLDERD